MIGVTRALTLAGRIEKRFFNPEAAERGTALHALTEHYDRGESPDVCNEWLGYMEAYQSFVATVRPDYGEPEWWYALPTESVYGESLKGGVFIERFVESKRLGVRGRVDRVCRDLFGGPAVLDLKFGAKQAWHGVQLAGYNRLCPIGARWSVYLKSNGRYELIQYDDPRDDRRFMSDLAIAHRIQETTTCLILNPQHR